MRLYGKTESLDTEFVLLKYGVKLITVASKRSNCLQYGTTALIFATANHLVMLKQYGSTVGLWRTERRFVYTRLRSSLVHTNQKLRETFLWLFV